MTAMLPSSFEPKASLELVARPEVAACFAAAQPAVVVAGDGRTLRFLNAAAARAFGLDRAAQALGRPAPLDEPILRQLARAAANLALGASSIEPVRFYRGIKPVVVTCAMLRLDEGALLVRFPDLAVPGGKTGVQATLDLYGGSDQLLSLFGDDEILAVTGEHTILDEAHDEIEAFIGRASDDPVRHLFVRTPKGGRDVVLIRLAGTEPAQRLLIVGPTVALAAATDGRNEASVERRLLPAETLAGAQAADFVFEPAARQQRFTWEADSTGRLTLGPELAARLGPGAAPLPGEDWNATAIRLDLDPDGRLAAALARQSPWSGLAVLWPVQGTALRVPVDLAGMPIIGRDRTMAGMRGFGIIRAVDAKADPAGTGLRLLSRSSPGPVADVPAAEEAEPSRLESPAEDVVVSPAPVDRLDDVRDVEDLPSLAQILASLDKAPVLQPDRPRDRGSSARAAFRDLFPAASDLSPVSPLALPESDGRAAARGDGNRQRAADGPAAETPPSARVVSLQPRADQPNGSEPGASAPHPQISPESLRLSGSERNAFRQIALALGARYEGDDVHPTPPAAAQSPQSQAGTDEDTGAGSAIRAGMPGDTAAILPPSRPEEPLAPIHRPGLSAPEARLIDRLPIAVGLVRNDSVIHVNAVFLALTGYASLNDLNEAGGLGALFAGPHAAKGWAAAANRRPLPLVTRDGRVLPVETRIASVPWQGGEAVLVSLIPDERARTSPADASAAAALEALTGTRQRVAELEAIVDTATDGVLLLDAQGRILSSNRAAEALFACERTEMDGKHLTKLLAPESRRPAFDYLDQMAKAETADASVSGRELTGLTQTGNLVPLFLTLGRLASGATTKYCAILRDITPWKKSEEALTLARRRAEEASVMKSEFLARISHEIRTPLNAIIGFSEVMLGERFGAIANDRYREYLRDILSSGTHIMSLVNDLLDLSKVEAGKMEMKFEAVQLTDLMAECISLMQPQANRDRIIIRSSLPGGLPLVVADRRSIRQIMLNLISNAIKFTPAGGQVIVSAAQDESGEIAIRVRDTGFGMTESEIGLALEPFRQLHTGRGRGGGTGLGLPLTKALAEANRASFRIESAVNQGTLAQVTFPMARVLAAE